MPGQQTCCVCTQSCADSMEDIPVCRYSHPIPTCESNHAQEYGRPCEIRCQLDQILLALNCQNQLLIDILGAVNSLTATILADHI